MPGIGVILNPYSRSNKKNPGRIQRFGFIVGDKGSCHMTDSLDEVRNLACEFMDRDVEILGIAGGDGTLHKTLTTFVEVYGERPLPKIAILRGGTMNNLAWQLGIKGSPENILSDLILKYHHGDAFAEKKINMIKVNGVYGFIFGLGLIEKFISMYQDVKTPSPQRGAWLLAKASVSSIINGKMAQHLTRRFDAKIWVDGKLAPFKNYTMIFAGTMETLGLSFRALYRGSSAPGKFQFVAVSSSGRHLLTTFHSALLGRRANSENYFDEMAAEVVFELDEPMSYIVDGDFPDKPSKRIEITTGPLLTCVIP